MDKTKMAVDVFDRQAHNYEQKFMDVSLYHHSLDKYCDRLSSAQATVLELACGPGNITAYVLGKMPELQILGTDLSPAMLALARKNNPAAVFELLDCRNILLLHINHFNGGRRHLRSFFFFAGSREEEDTKQKRSGELFRR